LALHIEGEIEAQNTSPNADDPSMFETRVSLRIEQQGEEVDSAIVVVHTSHGPVTLTQSGSSFIGTLHEYESTCTFDVEAGGVTLTGVSSTGPEVHHLTMPLVNATHSASDPLTVSWTPSGAQYATIATYHLAETSIPDTGTYTLTPGDLDGDSGRLEDDAVRVRRRSTVPIEGLPGSTMEFDIRNEVPFMLDSR
jgi:hypothetical protein